MAAKFSDIAKAFAKLEETSSNLEMIDILATLLGSFTPEEVRQFAYLSRGTVAPNYEGIDFGIAGKLVLRAIATAAGKDAAAVEKRSKALGDLGDTAADVLSRKRSGGLTLTDVFTRLRALAEASGGGSQEEKVNILAGLLAKCSVSEAKYVIRIVLGTLRLGAGEMTYLSALSVALTGDRKAKETLERAYNVLSDLGEVSSRAARDGVGALADPSPTPGIPVRVMLAQRIKELSELGGYIPGSMVAEYKYDGERIQAHILEDRTVRLFSRKHEDITHQFPDVVRALLASYRGASAIIEGEVVAIDQQSGDLKDFQTMSVRRRKHDIEEYVKKVPLKYFLFDALMLDGTDMMSEPLTKRQEMLRKHLKESDGLGFTNMIETGDVEEIESFFAEALAHGAEGLMIKNADGPYVAGSRGWQWIKFKRDYQSKLVDTFDVVVVGALWGRGRRAGTYGSLLVAAYDPEANHFASFTKVGAGFTDKNLESLVKRLKPYERAEKHRLVETGMDMDVWFDPSVVLELSGAEITVSPNHMVAKDQVGRGGLALRFPRFLRWRDDKEATDATTTEEIYQMFSR